MTVFLCAQDFEGILCGVYCGFMSRLGHDNVRLEFKDTYVPELFTQYKEVETIREIADQVVESVRKRISEDAYEMIYEASLSMDDKRADKIYRFLIAGFQNGSKVKDMLQLPEVFHIFEMCRHLTHEAHLLTGFTRFTQMEGTLYGVIGPKNDVLVLVARHFADRLPEENWILYDKIREKAAVHQSGRGWLIVYPQDNQWSTKLKRAEESPNFEELWTSFFHSINIKERENPKCQRNMLPLRYRTYMTEFQK